MAILPPGNTRWDPSLYDSRHSFVWKFGEEVVRLLDPKAGEKILDLGCGTGHLAARIAESGAEVHGIDGAATMVAEAKQAYPRLNFDVMDARQLPFRSDFDAVFSNAVLHWIRPPEQVAASVFASLKPGGRFVAEMGGKGNIQLISDALNGALQAEGCSQRYESNYYPSVGEYATVLEEAGFRVTYMAHFDRPTHLEGDEDGLRNWYRMFASRAVASLSEEVFEAVAKRAEELARPNQYRDGDWYADYVRLRFIAIRPDGS